MKQARNKLILISSLFLSSALQAFCYNADWQLIFNDEFAESSFQDGALRWNEKWNKIDYVNWASVSDWRKYQSRDNELVTQGSTEDTDYITLNGAYGDYTSQQDPTREQRYLCQWRHFHRQNILFPIWAYESSSTI